MIKDDPKNGKLREMIYKFWYRKYLDPSYDPSDMVLFVNNILLFTQFKKPKNYWECIIKSPGSVEALCDRFIRAADKYRCLEDKVISIIDDVVGGEKLRILPMSVTPKRQYLCYECLWCEECIRLRKRERNRSLLCDECTKCGERKAFLDSMGRLPSLIKDGRFVVVKFSGCYNTCSRCGILVY